MEFLIKLMDELKPSRIAALACALCLLASSCTTTRVVRESPSGAGSYAKGQTEEGVASWYGGKFHGRKTANGEIYNKHEMTAAHKTLPFGTIVEVTNKNNGRTVRLRINDRGPFIKGRIIDVSQKAAEKLEMIGSGIAPCLVEIVGFTE